MAIARQFDPQGVANLMWAFAKLGMDPGEVVGAMSRRAVAIAGQFNAQNVANLMWAYAALGVAPGEDVVPAMSRRAVAIAGQFNPQDMVNLMWAFAVLGIETGEELALILSSNLYAGAFNLEDMCQLHQCFLCMELEGFLQGACDPATQHAELADRCRRAFEARPTPASGMEFAIRRRLSAMGVGWAAGVRDQRTGYSLDLVLAGPAGSVAVEADGPSHFLAADSTGGQGRRERGTTRLKRRLLERAGWRLVTVRYWEWDEASLGGDAKEQAYLEQLLGPFGQPTLDGSPQGAPAVLLQHSPSIARPSTHRI